jgi:hypothetical protein
MNRLDKIFRQKLFHHTETSPAHLWDNIESRLPRENKRSPWFLLSAAILLCFVTGAIYRLSEMSGKKSEGQVYATKVNENTGSQSLETRSVTTKSVAVQNQNPVDDRMVDQNLKSKDSDGAWVGTKSEILQEVAESEGREILVPQTFEEPEKIKPISPRFLHGVRMPMAASLVHNTDASAELMKDVKACPFHFDTQNKSVDVYLSNEYGLKTLVADPSMSEHVQMRQQTETGRYSFGAGVRFGYNLSYRWNLHTGVNYSQINEKFEYTDPESNQTRLITIKDYVYDNGKIVDSIITEEVVIVPGMTKMKIFNTYRTLDIPVLARFTIFANRWMSLSALGGVYINLTSRQHGTILGPDNKTLVNISPSDTNGPSVFKTQLGVSGMAGASVAIHLNSSIDFLLEPHVRYYTSYMNTENYPANQKFTVTGLITGLRYKF